MRLGVQLLVYGLFLSSGATALVYQVAWVRNLSLIFGASFEAISIVLGSFMAGLALGGFYFGRRSNRVRRPLRLYGYLEIGVALFALALPLLLELVDRIYVGVALEVDRVNWAINLMRVVMAFCVLVLPTFFMGGTLPVLVSFLVHRYGELSGRLSGLYAINTLGAVVGTLSAGFVLLPALGVWRSQLVAVAGNAVIGLLAIVADRRVGARDPGDPEPADRQAIAGGAGPVGSLPADDSGLAAPAGERSSAAPAKPLPAPPGETRPEHVWALRLAFWGTALSGMGALALEVMWSRTISIATGSTTYSFTIMLAAFLVGIALGSWIHALMPLRRVHESVQFGLALFLIGLSSLVVSRWIPRLPEFALKLNMRFYGGAFGVRAGTTLVLSFLVMLVPCLFMGMAFPLAGQARARLKERFGESAGELVAFNTVGAIIGSLLAGFVVIPYVGLQRGMDLASCLYAGYGLLVLWVVAGSRLPRLRWAVAAGAVASLAAVCAGFLYVKPWNMRLLAAFQNNETSVYLDAQGRVDVRQWIDQSELLYYKEGRGSTVSVIQTPLYRAILINGKVVATDGVLDLHVELLLGHLPVLLNPHPKSAIVVGLGAGVTLGAVAAHADIEELTLVEIEPAVLGGAMQFVHVNNDAVRDPRLRIVYQDGRNFLLTTRKKFDVITADPIHPWAQGAAYLFTSEYYAMIRKHLTDRGIMCQWLPLYELSVENLKSVVASFAANFEHSTMWQTAVDVVLVGSPSPIRVDLEDLARRLKEPSVATHLGRIGLDDPLSLLADLTMDEEAVRLFTQEAIINTDDNLYLEFSSPHTIGADVLDHNARLVSDYREATDPKRVIASFAPFFESEGQAEETLRAYQRAKTATVLASVGRNRSLGRQSEAALMEFIEQIRPIWAELPGYGRSRRLLGAMLNELGSVYNAQGRHDRAIAAFRESMEVDPGRDVTHFNLGVVLQKKGREAEATAHYRRAIEIRPTYAEAHQNLGASLHAQGKTDEAIRHLETALEIKPDYTQAHVNLGLALMSRGESDRAIERYLEALEIRPDQPVALFNLGIALMSQGKLEEAIRRYQESVQLEPGFAPGYNNLGLALRAAGRFDEALARFGEALRLRSDWPPALIGMAWILATHPNPEDREPQEAIRLAGRAAQLTGARHPEVLDTLAAAYASAGRFDAAMKFAERALELAQAGASAELASSIRERLALYRERKAYVESPAPKPARR